MRNLIKYLIISGALLVTMTAFAQPSDTSKVLIDRQDALRVLAKAKETDLLKEKLADKEADINNLTARINGKDDIISLMKERKGIDSATLVTYEKEISVMKEQRKLFELDAVAYKKQIKKAKRKSRWLAISGILTTAGAFWLGTQF